MSLGALTWRRTRVLPRSRASSIGEPGWSSKTLRRRRKESHGEQFEPHW
jgi:hypothetical protein